MTIWKGPPAAQITMPKIRQRAKLPESDLEQIKNYLEKNYSVSIIAHMFGVKDSIIYGIKKKGKPIIMERQPPFEIEDKKIRRLIAYNFEWEYCKGFRKEFTVSKNSANLDEKTITGIINDYKFKCTSIDDIAIVSERCYELNRHFFHDIKP